MLTGWDWDGDDERGCTSAERVDDEAGRMSGLWLPATASCDNRSSRTPWEARSSRSSCRILDSTSEETPLVVMVAESLVSFEQYCIHSSLVEKSQA